MRGQVMECEWCWMEKPASKFNAEADVCDSCVKGQRSMWRNRQRLTLGASA